MCVTLPRRKVARPSPPPDGPRVVSTLNESSPERWRSLGTRRFQARLTSIPTFTVWLFWNSRVTLPTSCSCFSTWSSGQLQRLTPRPEPKLNPRLPSTNPPNNPDVNVLSSFSPGIPASFAGEPAYSSGSITTFYFTYPNTI